MIRLQNPTLIVKPITEEEAQKLTEGHSFGDLYVLYTNKEGAIEIGIPDMQKYFPATANMYGFREATEKAFFENGCSQLQQDAASITDRPVYAIQPTDDRQVGSFEILNDVNVDLGYVLDGSYQIGDEIKKR